MQNSTSHIYPNSTDSVKEYLSKACFLWLVDAISIDTLFTYLWQGRDMYTKKEHIFNEKIESKFYGFKETLL